MREREAVGRCSMQEKRLAIPAEKGQNTIMQRRRKQKLTVFLLAFCLLLSAGAWASGEPTDETALPAAADAEATEPDVTEAPEETALPTETPGMDGADAAPDAADAAIWLGQGDAYNAAALLRQLVGLPDTVPTPTPEPTPALTPEPPPTAVPTLTPEPTPTPEASAAPGDDGLLTVRFIDVGQGDAALLLCSGQAMLIDGGNKADSDLIYSVLAREGLDYLDYIVCTHAHEDHVGGLAGALNYAAVGTAYCSDTEYDSEAFRDFVRYLDAQGRSITVPRAGDTWTLGGAAVEVVGPIMASSNVNDRSIVLRVTFGDVSFLFTGDAERDEEQTILEAGHVIESTVLKVGHHGSSTSTSYPFLYAVDPVYAVISCGAGNSYGHPHEATLSRLRDADVTVFRTDMQGDVLCVTDGTTVTFTTERNRDADTLAGAGEGGNHTETEGTYILNTNTKRFHYPDCASVSQMSEKNRQEYTGPRDALIEMGYQPCGRCKP